MNTNLKDILLQYKGFLKTPTLWKKNPVYELQQIDLPKKNDSIFNDKVNSELRLGKLVERFVHHELASYKSIQILAENVQIQNDKITIGEIDFILRINNIPVHLEVIYKFYLYDKNIGNTELEHWIGPNKKDNLVKKLTKLKEKQLPIIYNKFSSNILKDLEIDIVDLEQYVYFKAQLFIPFKSIKPQFKNLNEDCIKGFYIHFDKINELNSCKFYIPSKVNWLQEIQIHKEWLNFEKFSIEIQKIIKNKSAPLCWLKYPNGETEKFFVIWW
ncbi:DUF1853 family protein [Urechidicola croceus]|uniref:DUF1853 domain-containing protein n=1 Tax=Urechidicola croceus TaxID=1850246 RepID=A0A1D8P5E5_9FLAO|nr:DUF1853 family protein [Urechidicola croceus]AOW19812.1 hypothetical protein LPB138_03545 [Urechidicola croceus]